MSNTWDMTNVCGSLAWELNGSQGTLRIFSFLLWLWQKRTFGKEKQIVVNSRVCFSLIWRHHVSEGGVPLVAVLVVWSELLHKSLLLVVLDPITYVCCCVYSQDWITTCRPHGKSSVIRELKDFVARVSSCGPPYLRWADHIRILCPSLVWTASQ